MAQQKQLIGHVKGDPGEAAGFGTISASIVDAEEPSVDASWDGPNTGKNLTLTFKGIKGPAGPVGPVGKQGDAGKDAKIESVTVTSDNTHSDNPTAEVTMGGEAGAQTVEIAFTGLQGAPGKDGAAAAIGEIKAEVDDQTGTPSVEVETSGQETDKTITLKFHNLKGADGTPGAKGDTGGYYKPSVTEEGQLSFEALNGAEDLEETWNIKGADGPAGKDAVIETVNVQVDSQHLDEPTASATVEGSTINFDFKGIVGAAGKDGVAGDKGDTGGYYKPTVSPEGQLSFTAENGADPIEDTWEIKGPQGDNGAPGKDGINAKIETVTVTVDTEHSDSPSATATIEGDAGAQTLTLDFKGLMGATGPQGTPGVNGDKGDTGGYYKPSVSESGELSFEAINGAEEVSDKWNIKGTDGAKGDTGGYYEPTVDDAGQLTFTEKNGAPHIDGSWNVKGADGAAGKNGIDAKISAVNITVDAQHLEEPTATASISGEAGDQTLTLDFKGLVGATGANGSNGATGPKGDAGGYYTPTVSEEGQLSFTAENGAPELSTKWDIKGPTGAAGPAGSQGPAGIDAKITSVTVSSDATHLDQPTATATISGDAGDQTLDIKFTGLQGAKGADGQDFKPGGAATDVTLGDGTTKAISELANDEGFIAALLANQSFIDGLVNKLPFLEVTTA